jgi:paraquat-inducible protein B
MSKKANSTMIGLFIVSGVALGVLGLLLFSSLKLFARTQDVIAYFNDSVNGLAEGAPVKYRGVTIGSVKRVMVRFNQATNDYAMPVILELEEKLLRKRMVEAEVVFTKEALEARIQRGLRATLGSESLLTGVLYIEIHPEMNALPPVFHQLKKIYPELPTVPTEIQRLLSNLASLDIKRMETNLNELLAKLDEVIGNLKTAQINQGVTNLLNSLDRLVSSPEITNDLVAVHTTLAQYRTLGEKLNIRIDPLANDLSNALTEANRALAKIRGAGENLRTLLAPDSALRDNLDLALQQLAGAAQSISGLVELLKEHPNALITGRQVEKRR